MLIYLVRNRVNQKVYIGQHRGNDYLRRWKVHVLSAGRGSATLFHRAIRKYGANSFSVTLLSRSATSFDDLDKQEILFIQKYKANDRAFGYNIAKGGRDRTTLSMLGRHQTSYQKRCASKIGRRNVESGLLARLRTPSHQAAAGRKGGMLGGKVQGPIQGKRNVKSGLLRRICADGGTAASHVRWHVKRKKVERKCALCRDAQ